jgi:hypothetical protein
MTSPFHPSDDPVAVVWGDVPVDDECAIVRVDFGERCGEATPVPFVVGESAEPDIAFDDGARINNGRHANQQHPTELA